MDFSLSKSNISTTATVFEANITQNIDSDLTLPEYVEDIETVLNCSVNTNIDSVVLTDRRITVEGYALIRLFYETANGKLCCFESSVPFSRFAENDALEDGDCITADGCTQYTNCRLVNPRRFDVHSNLSINVKATRVICSQIVSSAEGGGIELDKAYVNTANACAVSQRAQKR